ncbi:orotidine-5'-phosphate decarboxylase [Pyrococcus furiosus DSM 3638]|uniref:Orotidine 5'-phosphate decarboxylase n=2 Tax=Pyrococcus furiosus (strain ATCC 43587 / DSM 3638 / JCM 8422 / Vc1) TaxID=186497 RepID=PYRF_PYRFU|nr:orotidine-5'-phosphate decarboxylase [Pyrococcus furiosus]Q8U1U1.1 RecName: Full=Orotidine 5'-phosphate decarboxylase; AltName: Full=OMP decarboxylase; Short=OMPDCase; Short=OMPdecase [Pyrococcus furiosus DSM 3638]AAL81238.1 orotidine-5'-phosphate decarboxylase [Pyrococcus furiosus DSM 3638]QEK78769.1 orotidine-5'-phosphate decarboxylase [Pyrococcus furiosus DSM 3638]
MIVLALDVYEREKALSIAEDVKDYISMIKVNWPLIIGSGLGVISELKKKTGLPIIADLKLADIPNTNRLIAKKVYDAGADYIILHSFVGRDSVKAVKELGEIIMIVEMSHPGALEFINPLTDKFIDMANEIKPFGVIAPGTRPERIRYIRERLSKDIKVLTPGIGAQGGSPVEALKAGADYIIIGRAIYNAERPREAAKKIFEEVKEWSSR